ncbi:hypothetical protein NEOLI_000175 [Neolecta irregularis DAH-3]|uniref:Mediator of RNA polymerase II transcription subunit 11 n=1 Tax=Neolecta irregularis (strain DAH-3) TaxID=1198029 RepID=A0A1U7LTY1_NEOID|nr:hypothetical protein NEOLI_000175 [Neolecta irregularis DAH-3]|eukprot:OLL26002.1 hypothetical protein NEOLI_000175 [Neolecta irregularis DAH-3]
MNDEINKLDASLKGLILQIAQIYRARDKSEKINVPTSAFGLPDTLQKELENRLGEFHQACDDIEIRLKRARDTILNEMNGPASHSTPVAVNETPGKNVLDSGAADSDVKMEDLFGDETLQFETGD